MRRCPHCTCLLAPDSFYGPTPARKTQSWCIECCRVEARLRYTPAVEGPDALYVAWNPRIPGEIKIGRARNPFQRLASLSSCQNFHIELVRQWPGLGHLESKLHAQFSDFRVRNVPGREWFALPPEDIGLIENCVEFLMELHAKSVAL